ncbi:MAG: LTA synthase family protein [Lachnospiraceae bacterium]|nr:LTA synthase family protein [Lachnospiraceae bacterium]
MSKATNEVLREANSSDVSSRKREKRKKYFILALQILASLFFLFLFAYFLRNKGFYLKKVTDQETGAIAYKTAKKTFGRICTAVSVSGLGILLCWIPNKLGEKVNKIVYIVSCLLSPVIAFLILEYLNESEWWAFKPFILAMNFIILYFVFFTFTAIFGSMKRGSIGTILLACAFALTNHFVYQFRGIAFMASDIKIAGTALGVIDNFDFTFSFICTYTIGFTALAVTYFARLKGTAGLTLKKYVLRLALWAASCAVFIYSFMYTDLIRGVYFKTFHPHITYQRYGQALIFVRSFHMIMAEKPDGYNYTLAQEVSEKRSGQADLQADTMTSEVATDLTDDAYKSDGTLKTTEKNPNILIVMDEAFSDLGTVGEFDVNQDYMPFIHNLTENTIKGTTYVSVFGGRTANTEYELLTGNTMAFLPDGTTTYQFFLKKDYPNLVHYLKNKGYQGINAIHPYYRGGYNRVNVYQYFGFENFYDIADFDNPETLRKYITDASTYDKMIELYEEAKKTSDAPYFSFCVTMQNHSSFARTYKDMPHDIVLGEDYQDATADQYLNLIKVSDSALEELIDYFKGVDEPTLIIFFGDHQPQVSNAFYDKIMGKKQDELTDEEVMEKYKTPFLAWANYDIEEKDNVTISTNYMISTIFDELGLDMPRYNRLLLEFQKEIPVLTAVGYRGADGKYYSVDDEESPYIDTLQDYEILQYNELFDRKKWVSGLYEDEL